MGELMFNKNVYVNTKSDKILFTEQQVDDFLCFRQDVYVYHLRKEKVMWLCPVDIAAGKKVEEGWEYNFVEENVKLDPFELTILKLFHWSWIEVLDLNSTWFKTLNKTLVAYKKVNKVFPVAGTYKVFQMPIKDVKLVVIGESPYPNSNANGIAFASEKITPTLKVIEKNIAEDFNYSKHFKLETSLNTWEWQGVLLLNSYLTVSSDKEYHRLIWKPFIKKVVDVLSDKPFILLGSNAKSYKPLIKGKVFEAEHPAASIYNERDWEHNHVFKQAVEYLITQGIELNLV
jgi:uracil-DNA glycosylase